MSGIKVALNADMGESFGLYKIGNDEALMPYLTTANLACGFHGADPMVMQSSVRLAKKYDVSVGAHPGFQDRQGFGRRMLRLSPQELYTDTLYQMGALDAFARVEGMELTHVCPHGLVDPLISDNEEYARAFIKAMQDFNPKMKLVIEEKSLCARICGEIGQDIAMVGYPDLMYDKDGNIVISRERKLMDPGEVAAQALRMITKGETLAVDGNTFPVKVDILTFHGDVPNCVEILQEVHQVLKDAKVELARY